MSLEGYVTASYADLVTAFGPPNDLDGMDDYKCRAQWRIGHVVIYDWKTGQELGRAPEAGRGGHGLARRD